MARNPRSRASKAGNRKALEMVREDMMDLPEGPEEVAALPEGLGPQTKFLGTDERGLPTVGTATPAQVSEAAATYAEKLKDKPGFEEAARVTAEGRLPGMPDLDVADRKAEKKTEEKLDVKPMNWTGYGGFEYSVDPARPGQIKINGKLFTDEQLRANTRKRGKEVGISDILLEKTDIENKGIKIAPRAKETPTARRRRIAEQALAPSAPTPAPEEFPQSEPEDFMTGAGAMPAAEGPSLAEAFATPAPEVTQEEQRPPQRTRREALAARSEAARGLELSPEQAERIFQLGREVARKTDEFGRGDVRAEQQAYQNILESLGLGTSDFPAAQPRKAIGSEMAEESVANRDNELFNALKREAYEVLGKYRRGMQPADVERALREEARRRGR